MRLAARLGNRRVGLDPKGRVRPRELPDPDFLLFLIMPSSDISMAAYMFTGSELGFISIIAMKRGERGSSCDLIISLMFKNKDGPI